MKRILCLSKRPYGLHWLTFWQKTVGTAWDHIIDLRRTPTAWALRGPLHILPPERPNEHKVAHYARTLRLSPPPAPTLWLHRNAQHLALGYLPAGRRYLAIGATANWAGKIWPAENFIKAVEQLTAAGAYFEGMTPVLFGAPGEETQVEKIIHHFGDRAVNLVGQLDPLTTAAAVQRCAFCIANDSGLMHVASAAGVPTLGLFGPSHPEIYGPWGPLGYAVRTEKTFAELTGAPDYDHRTTGSLMHSLSVKRVVEAAQSLWVFVQARPAA